MHVINNEIQNVKYKITVPLTFSFTCRCGAFPGSDENKQELEDLVKAYQQGLRDLVKSGRYDTRDDFTVVDQPFFSETKIPTTVSYKIVDHTINKTIFVKYA